MAHGHYRIRVDVGGSGHTDSSTEANYLRIHEPDLRDNLFADDQNHHWPAPGEIIPHPGFDDDLSVARFNNNSDTMDVAVAAENVTDGSSRPEDNLLWTGPSSLGDASSGYQMRFWRTVRLYILHEELFLNGLWLQMIFQRVRRGNQGQLVPQHAIAEFGNPGHFGTHYDDFTRYSSTTWSERDAWQGSNALIDAVQISLIGDGVPNYSQIKAPNRQYHLHGTERYYSNVFAPTGSLRRQVVQAWVHVPTTSAFYDRLRQTLARTGNYDKIDVHFEYAGGLVLDDADADTEEDPTIYFDLPDIGIAPVPETNTPGDADIIREKNRLAKQLYYGRMGEIHNTRVELDEKLINAGINVWNFTEPSREAISGVLGFLQDEGDALAKSSGQSWETLWDHIPGADWLDDALDDQMELAFEEGDVSLGEAMAVGSNYLWDFWTGPTVGEVGFWVLTFMASGAVAGRSAGKLSIQTMRLGQKHWKLVGAGAGLATQPDLFKKGWQGVKAAMFRHPDVNAIQQEQYLESQQDNLYHALETHGTEIRAMEAERKQHWNRSVDRLAHKAERVHLHNALYTTFDQQVADRSESYAAFRESIAAYKEAEKAAVQRFGEDAFPWLYKKRKRIIRRYLR